MRYNDLVYGAIEVPQEVWELFSDPILVRLRNISQAVLPVEMNPFGTAMNRFQHGLGVWWLLQHLCRREEFRHLSPTLPLAGLLHDAGNPPFSHTGDWFMRDAIGHDGETHLREVLIGSELAVRLRRLGADPERIADLVAGNAKPWSDLLAGSLDADNLDNIKRYGMAQGLDGVDYNAHRILDALQFSLGGDAIELDGGAFPEVQRWKHARRVVYRSVYSESHLGMAMMLQRALEIAYVRKEIAPSFWRFSDPEAIGHLLKTNDGTRALIERLRGLQAYNLVAAWDGTEPPFECNWSDWRVRKAVADDAAETAGAKPWQAAAYLGVGRDAKRISLLFRTPEGEVHPDSAEDPPQYRIRIYLHPRAASTKLLRLIDGDVVAFARRAVNGRFPKSVEPPKAVSAQAGF
ncbi:MAG: HD domain-containing protein [Candidatus Sungbacteria bacterium]|uniref:HD domain-containing protein n=1 Tax=Candidatus Sungiibacteriota bacterium TaxID=2750080 RepID=A0A933DT78_9BACT|nr:HD domain-containing protein [Candidatus Sungbacteria bacterium]